MFRQCREMNLPEPKFEEFGDGIKVTVYRANGTEVGTNGIKVGINDNEAGIIEDVENTIIELIDQNPKVTQKKLSEKLNIPERTLKRIMTEMQEKHEIERVGSNRGGYWKILKNRWHNLAFLGWHKRGTMPRGSFLCGFQDMNHNIFVLCLM